MPRLNCQAIKQVFFQIEEDPFGPGTKKLDGELKDFRRIRTGAIRVVYRVDENEKAVRVIAVLPRGDVYKRL